MKFAAQNRLAAGKWMLFSLLAALPFQAPRAQVKVSDSANQLVRRVIQNEQRASKNRVPHMYRLRRETPKGSTTKELVETREGRVAKLVAVNDQPPPPDARKWDDEKLAKLATDPHEQRERWKEQRKDEDRVMGLVSALPDAFLYEYDGTEHGKYGELVRLRFKPNPDFDPPTRETYVYKAAEGKMWIDKANERLVKFEATLADDVSIGWGIIGRLNKGGQILVEQSRVAPQRWEITRLQLDFTGKALLFKSIVVNQTQTAFDFRPVPQDLSVKEGVELLQKQATIVAKN